MADAKPQGEGIDNLRQAYEALEKDHTTLRNQHRELQAQVAIEKAGLNEKHAELFLKVVGSDGDITVDAAKSFVEEYGLKPAEQETPPPTPEGAPEAKPVEENPTPESLAGMSGAGTPGSGQTPPSPQGQKLTTAQFEDLLKTDRNAALLAYKEGRVATQEGNVFAEQAKRAGVLGS